MANTVRILSIDGGGVRGIIPAMLVRELEKRTGQPIYKLFDLIAGTSTGGFVTLVMTKPGPNGGPLYSGDDLVQIYVEHAKDFFSRSLLYEITSLNGWTSPKYPGSDVSSVMTRYLDKYERTELKQALTHVLVTSYEIDQRRPVLFTSRAAIADPDQNFFMSDVGRATTAAPTYFPAVEVKSVNGGRTYHTIDGGLVANNPSLCALAEAIRAHGLDADYLVISLGTGEYEAPIPYNKAKGWGLVGWAPGILDVLFDGTSNTVDLEATEILQPKDGWTRYYRFQTVVPQQNDALDDAHPANIERLTELATTMIDEQSDLLNKVADRLKPEVTSAGT